MALVEVECDNEDCVHHRCGECGMESITVDDEGCCEEFERRNRQ